MSSQQQTKPSITRKVMRGLTFLGALGSMWHFRDTLLDFNTWKDPRNIVVVFSALYFGRALIRGFKKPLPTDVIRYDEKTIPGKTGVLLVNLGTPDGVNVPAVRRFLTEFLSDNRVVDAPAHCRWMLVNLIISPFRSPNSAKMYKRIWDMDFADSNMGSPIMKYGVQLTDKVADQLHSKYPEKYEIELAMRYQNPSIESALMNLKKKCVEHIVVIPLFPQYSSACTGSIYQKVFDVMQDWDRIPHLTINSTLLDMPAIVETFKKNAEEYMKDEYDHFVFSYHGVPVKQISKGSLECNPTGCPETGCCSKYTERNRLCYRAGCYQTSRLIAESLNIPKEKYTVTFQSRLGPTQWLQPYTDETLVGFAKGDQKRVLVFSPAFVADCLETIDEIASELREEFFEHGGEKFDLVPSLNVDDIFVKGVVGLIEKLSVYKQ